MSTKVLNIIAAGVLAGSLAGAITSASAETLRLLTWGNYAPDEVVQKFEAKYPDIHVQVTLSNNEEMIAKLRATGGSGWDLAQPSHDRIMEAQVEYGIYKPMDLSKVHVNELDPQLLAAVKHNTTINGKVYSIPFMWGTAGLVVNKTKAPDVKKWTDLCDPKYKGKVSMRLRRIILLGTAFAMGYDPFAAYHNKDKYRKLMDRVQQKLIACKDNVRAYWHGGDQLMRLMMSGEVVASGTWSSTANRLHALNPKFVFVPPESGALAWIDTFTLPKNGKADDAAYKWINFVMQPDIEKIIAAHCGATPAVKNGMALMPAAGRESLETAFSKQDLNKLKFFPNVPPGIEDIEGKVLDNIKAAH